MQSLFDDLNIHLTRVQTSRLHDAPVCDMKVPTVLYHLGVAKKSEACPTDLQSRFHTIQARYRDHQCMFTDGSKHDNKVGCAVVYDGCFLRERLRDTASVYTAESRAILLAVHRAICSNRDKFVVCVDS